MEELRAITSMRSRCEPRGSVPLFTGSTDLARRTSLGNTVWLGPKRGLQSGNRIAPSAVGGYLQAFRSQNDADWGESVEGRKNHVGRKIVMGPKLIDRPPGLGKSTGRGFKKVEHNWQTTWKRGCYTDKSGE